MQQNHYYQSYTLIDIQKFLLLDSKNHFIFLGMIILYVINRQNNHADKP
jgi:hypothetical protein